MNMDLEGYFKDIQADLASQWANISFLGINAQDQIWDVQLDDSAYAVIEYLKTKKGYTFLTDLCGMHFPDHPSHPFSVVYHLHNWLNNTRIRIHCMLTAEPQTPTLTGLFLSANWQERETYDFYGIVFTDHPDLRRILNMDDMVSFPLRKEFAMEDSGRQDKDDRYFGRTPQKRVQ